jgi:hypothetical protein
MSNINHLANYAGDCLMYSAPTPGQAAEIVSDYVLMETCLRYLLEQTIEQDERHGITLTEGERDAAELARAILARIDAEG